MNSVYLDVNLIGTFSRECQQELRRHLFSVEYWRSLRDIHLLTMEIFFTSGVYFAEKAYDSWKRRDVSFIPWALSSAYSFSLSFYFIDASVFISDRTVRNAFHHCYERCYHESMEFSGIF